MVNFRDSTNIRDLATIQGGILADHGTMQTVLARNGTCVDSGIVPLISGLVPLIPIIYYTSPATITSSVVDARGRVVVLADGEYAWAIPGSPVYQAKNRYIFEPVCGTCQFRLVDFYMSAVDCM